MQTSSSLFNLTRKQILIESPAQRKTVTVRRGKGAPCKKIFVSRISICATRKLPSAIFRRGRVTRSARARILALGSERGSFIFKNTQPAKREDFSIHTPEGFSRNIIALDFHVARIAPSKNADRTDIARKFHVRGEPWPVKLNRVISFRAMDSHGFAKKHCAGSSTSKSYIRRIALCRFIIVPASDRRFLIIDRQITARCGFKLYHGKR